MRIAAVAPSVTFALLHQLLHVPALALLPSPLNADTGQPPFNTVTSTETSIEGLLKGNNLPDGPLKRSLNWLWNERHHIKSLREPLTSQTERDSCVKRIKDPSINLLMVVQEAYGSEEKVFLKEVVELESMMNELLSFAPEYDYRYVKANGFRTLAKMIRSLIEVLAAAACLKSTTGHSSDQLMLEHKTLTRSLKKAVDVAKLIHSKGRKYSCTTLSEDVDMQILTTMFTMDPSEIEPIFASTGPFFVKTGVQKELAFVLRMIAAISSPNQTEMNKILVSQRYAARSQAVNSLAMSLEKLKGGVLKKFPLNMALESNKVIKANYLLPRDVQMYDVERSHNLFVLRPPDHLSPVDIIEVSDRRGTVRSLIVKPETMRFNDTLVMWTHGGAFMMGSADGCETWARDLGATFICPEYRLAPENKYPAGMQDLLDVYMFVTSGADAVAEAIGFHPRIVMLAGDSSGGQMSISLTIIVNAIRKRNLATAVDSVKNMVPLPHAIVSLYPSAIPGFILHPSSSYQFMDPVISVGVVALVASFYPEVDPHVEDDLWYRKPSFPSVVRRFNGRLEDPFFNVLAFRDWLDLSNISLTILSSEMDSMLDHGVLLAKHWRGPVAFHVAWSMPHGFANFRSSDAKQGIVNFVTLMDQAVKRAGG